MIYLHRFKQFPPSPKAKGIINSYFFSFFFLFFPVKLKAVKLYSLESFGCAVFGAVRTNRRWHWAEAEHEQARKSHFRDVADFAEISVNRVALKLITLEAQ